MIPIWISLQLHQFLSYAVFSPSPVPTSHLFDITPHLWLIPDSTLHKSYIIQVVFIFLFVLCSSCQLCSVYLLTTSCFILWSFFIPFHHSSSLHVNILCMWFLCALLLPSFFSLNVACDILCVSFHSYLHCYGYSIHVQLHIYSHSFILSSLAYN